MGVGTITEDVLGVTVFAKKLFWEGIYILHTRGKGQGQSSVVSITWRVYSDRRGSGGMA
jgi:hypothetical protein